MTDTAEIFTASQVEKLRARSDRQDGNVRAERDMLAAEVRLLRHQLNQRDALIQRMRGWGRKRP
jgi:hypothetical protein